MSISQFFQKLNAPLKNKRWSWGSVRLVDGAVILRVWFDQKTRIDDRDFVRLTHHEKFIGREHHSGYKERIEHVELIRSGHTCYLVICTAKDPEASPRTIKCFKEREIFVGGELIEKDGDTWIEREKKISVQQAMQ